MGDAPVVQGGQQSQQGAVLAGVEAGAARVRAAGVHRLARTEGEAGDDAALAPPLHCSEDTRLVGNERNMEIKNRLLIFVFCSSVSIFVNKAAEILLEKFADGL